MNYVFNNKVIKTVSQLGVFMTQFINAIFIVLRIYMRLRDKINKFPYVPSEKSDRSPLAPHFNLVGAILVGGPRHLNNAEGDWSKV